MQTPGSQLARGRHLARLAGLGLLIVALLAAPMLSGSYHLSLLTEILIFAIFAMSFDLLLGYTGLMSFGHAAFFGLGAYCVVILNATFGLNAFLCLPLGVALAAVTAMTIGYFCTLLNGIPFLMVTIASAQLVYSIALRWRDLTGGSDGIGGLVRPSFLGMSLDDSKIMYYVALAAFFFAYALLNRIVRSQLGHVFIGIRENEGRMIAFGYPTLLYRRISFAIGGALAGFSGGLYGIFNAFISADALYWSASGDVLIMVVLGGVGTLIGPVLGTGIFLLAKHYVSSLTDYWMFIVGSIFIGCVMFLPKGIYGALARETKS